MMLEANHPPQATLHEYADNALAATEATAVAGHLATCEACRAEVASFSGLVAALATVDEVPMGRDLSGAVLGQLAAEGAWGTGATRRWLALLWSLQGVIAVALLVFLWPALDAWWTAVITSGGATAAAWQARMEETLAAWQAAVAALAAGWQSPMGWVEIPPDQLILGLGLILAAWLAGNGLLLRSSGNRHHLNGGSHG